MSNIPVEQQIQIQKHSNPPVTVVGWLPPQFSYDQGATYEQPFKVEGWAGSMLNAFNKSRKFFKGGGYTPGNPALTAQQWQASSIPELSIRLQLECDNADPLNEIRKPIIDLLGMVTPKVAKGFMYEAPGPIIDYSSVLKGLGETSESWDPRALIAPRNAISVKIGQYMHFKSVVITGVNTKLNHIIDSKTGWPMSAEVEVAFSPIMMPAVDDVEKTFLMR